MKTDAGKLKGGGSVRPPRLSAGPAKRLHNSCVVSALLDAAKTCGITQVDKKRFDACAGRCLGRMSGVKQHTGPGTSSFRR